MPQVDLETLVSACAGGNTDRKITCETLADTTAAVGKEEEGLPEEDDEVAVAVEVVAPDFPPESFWLSKDAEFDWFDRNAFLERKESTKGLSISTNFYASAPSSQSNSNSQRFSKNLKSKAAIIGLPKTQKNNFIDCKRRPANIQLFPKRSQSVGKSVAAMAEPSSPKVSCIGRVRSKKGRRRSAETSTTTKKEKSIVRSRSDDHEKRRKGLYSRVVSMFSGRRRDRKTRRSKSETKEVVDESMAAKEVPRRKSAAELRTKEFPVQVEPAPAMGGMRKFASGRRSQSWSTDDFDVALSELLVIGPTIDQKSDQ